MSTQTLERTYTCMERVYAGNVIDPAEYCSNEVSEEDAFCEEHGGDAMADADDRAYTTWKENR